MAAGWSVILEREVAIATNPSAGRSLLYYQRQIDELALRLDLPPLSSFFSRSPHDIAAYLRNQGVEPDLDALPDEEWYEPTEGLTTVRGLLAALADDPTAAPESHKIIADLEVIERALTVAAEQDVRFHLGRELPQHELG